MYVSLVVFFEGWSRNPAMKEIVTMGNGLWAEIQDTQYTYPHPASVWTPTTADRIKQDWENPFPTLHL